MKLCPRESENACFAEESVPPFPPSPTIDLFRRAREAIEDAHARATAAKTAEGRVVAVATPAAAMREKAPAASAGRGARGGGRRHPRPRGVENDAAANEELNDETTND